MHNSELELHLDDTFDSPCVLHTVYKVNGLFSYLFYNCISIYMYYLSFMTPPKFGISTQLYISYFYIHICSHLWYYLYTYIFYFYINKWIYIYIYICDNNSITLYVGPTTCKCYTRSEVKRGPRLQFR